MKRVLFVFMMVLLVISILAANILFSSGFFREIKPKLEGEIEASINLPGVEDIAISREDQFLILSSDDRAARRDRIPTKGGLFFLDLKNNQLTPKLISKQLKLELNPHGISLIRIDSGEYQILVINHVGDQHSVEKFSLFGDSLVHIETISDPLFNSPNDLIAINSEEFYLTNDHKYRTGFNRILEDYLGLSLSNVIYYKNGKTSEVAPEIAYANGINYLEDQQLIFVASTRGFRVCVYEKLPDGSLKFREQIKTKTGVDNIEIDENGTLWIGSHPNLLMFASYAKGKLEITPSEIITIDYRAEGDYQVKSVFMDDGEIVSGSSVAVPHDNRVFIGNVMDDHVTVWKR